MTGPMIKNVGFVIAFSWSVIFGQSSPLPNRSLAIELKCPSPEFQEFCS